MFQTEHLQEKWQPVLEHPDLPKIEDAYKRAVTTIILENQEKSLKEDRAFLSEAEMGNEVNVQPRRHKQTVCGDQWFDD